MKRRLTLMALLGCGCIGPPAPPPVRLSDDPPPASVSSGVSVQAPLRRLTREQYRRSVIDLFAPLQWTQTPAAGFPADETAGPFLSNVRAPISPLQVDLAMSAADELATLAVDKLDVLLASCRTRDEACALEYLRSLARRAWRRPVTDEERAALASVFRAGGGDVARGVRLGISAVLASPSFLYLVEPGTATTSGRLALSDHAVAARLSYLLWNTTPDDALLKAADARELSTPAGVAAQAWRLLRDDRSTPQLGRFHQEWLGVGNLDALEKDPTRYPFFTAAARASMKAETTTFVDTVIRRSDGRLETLLSAPFSAPGEASLQVYGVDARADTLVGLDPSRRAGLLTQPAFLATHANPKTTSPTHRGLFIVTQLLCITLGKPPAGVDTSPIGVDATGQRTRRQLVEAHASTPACAGCHRLMDPIGLAFEHYDAVGAWRDVDLDDRQPIDSSVTVLTGTDIDGPVTSAVQLTSKLARSKQVRSCAATQWYRFALGRLDTIDDTRELELLRERFDTSGGSVPDLIIAIVTSDAFRTRAP